MKTKRKTAAYFAILFIIVLIFTGCSAPDDTDTGIHMPENDEYSPVSGLTLTESEAAALNNSMKVKIYYKTLKGDKLSCETKLVQFTEKDRKTDVLAYKIIQLMISGPSNSNLVKTIPEGSAVNSVKVKNGVAYVDFNEAFAGKAAQSSDCAFIAKSIANTLTEFKNINEVAITCSGNKIEGTADINFSKLVRDMSVVTDIESAAPETDYSENVFLEIELE